YFYASSLSALSTLSLHDALPICTIRIWDWAKGQEIRKFNKPAGNREIFGGESWLAYSPDGKLLAAAELEISPNGNESVSKLKLWDPATGTHLRTIASSTNGDVVSPVFSPDSKTLAYSSYDGMITLVEVATGKEIRKLQDN